MYIANSTFPPGLDVLSPVDEAVAQRVEAIQPHGVLVALTEPGFIVVLASANAAHHLGVDAAQLIGTPLQTLIGSAAIVNLRRLSSVMSAGSKRTLAIVANGQRFDGAFHRSDGLLVLELEPATVPAAGGDDGEDFYDFARDLLRRFGSARDLKRLWPKVAEAVQEISGFDLVMVHRFDPRDGSGEVIAERKRPCNPSFLGLRYPASEIPEAERRLYLKNRVRLIPNVAYTPVGTIPKLNPLTRNHLDLSHAVLRSAPLAYRESLATMGVGASMTISLVKDGELWGIICCQHYEPRVVPVRVRRFCEYAGDLVSWILAPLLESEERDARLGAATLQSRLLEYAAKGPDTYSALTQGFPSALDLIRATGFVVAQADRLIAVGATPSTSELTELLEWLGPKLGRGLYATDRLPHVFPPARTFRGTASGLLAARVRMDNGAILLWFRPELTHAADSAGNQTEAEKPLGAMPGRQRSFASWRETVRERSQAWAPWEVRAVNGFRGAVARLLLQRTAASLSLDLQQAVRSRDDFLTMASHELRTPTTTLRLHLQALNRIAHRDQYVPRDIDERLTKVNRQVDRIGLLIQQLLDVSQIVAGHLELDVTRFSLEDLAREVIDRFSESGVKVEVTVEGDLWGTWDRCRLEQVFVNLLSNAIKYGQGKTVDVVLRGQGDVARGSVRDHGVGIPLEARERVFRRFEPAAPLANFSGFGLGLWIAREITERHHGRIYLESELSVGSTFTFELPRDIAEQLS